MTGATGQLGHDLVAAMSGQVPVGGLRGDSRTGWLGERPPVDVVGASHRMLDVTNRTDVLETLSTLRPELVVHAAAFTAVDRCEDEPDSAFAVNALGTRHVAEAARLYGARLVVVSTDYVFSGTATRPYSEWDPTGPLQVYGRSKLAAESEAGPYATVVRTSWTSGAHGSNMVKTLVGLCTQKPARQMRFVDDQRGRPTFTADLAGAILSLADSGRPGLFHVTNDGEASWFDLARAVAERCGEDPERVEPVKTAELHPPRRAERPAYSVLDNAAMRLSGMAMLPHWSDGLDRLTEVLLDRARAAT